MSIAHHNVTLKPDSKHEGQPFLVECSCHTEGRFSDEGQAMAWAHAHIQGCQSPNVTFQNLCHVKAMVAQ